MNAKVQIGAELLCKGGKVNDKNRVQSTEYRLRREGRGVASPRPPMVEVKAKPCPYPIQLKRGTGDRDNCNRLESTLNYLSAKL